MTAKDESAIPAIRGQAKAGDPKWAWAPYQPGGANPWNLALAAHLERRAGFGASWSQLQQALTDGPQKTVARLLHPPTGVEEFEKRFAMLAVSSDATPTECAESWLYRMLQTPHPLLEKMTLFWHNYFAVSGDRAAKAGLVDQHLRLLRIHALGRFDALAGGILRDPATLIAFNAPANRKTLLNEEFANAFLSRYTVGPGSFSAGDVRDAARAFTGASVLRGEYFYSARDHDEGSKTILGQQGTFNGDDAVRIALANPATPRSVVRKLYGWLIAETGEPVGALIEPLAESFAKDYDIANIVGVMLRSNLFFSDVAYRQRVKSPVEFALGIAAAFEASLGAEPLYWQLAGLGQQLTEPPTRDGWPGGRNWLNRYTLVARANLAAALLAASEGPYAGKLNPQAVAEKQGHGDLAAMARFLLDLLVQNDVAPETSQELTTNAATAQARGLAHAIVTLPEFQLA